MQLDSFLLADNVIAAEGKLYIHGGGITRINAPAVPIVVPQLMIIVRLLLDPEEVNQAHELQLELADPAGRPVILAPPSRIPAPGDAGAATGEEQFLQLILGLAGILLETVVIYRLTVSIDGEVLRALSLPVVLIDRDDEPTVAPAPRPNREQRRRKS